MTDVRLSVSIGAVDVSAECPTSPDGALPYSLAEVLASMTTEAVRAFRESGVGDFEFTSGDDDDA